MKETADVTRPGQSASARPQFRREESVRGSLPDPMNGVVVAIRGSVVDVGFERDLPHINTVLRTGRNEEIVIEVLAQLDEHRIKGIALTPTQGLARGMTVLNTGGPLKTPVGRNILSECLMSLDESSTARAR